MKRARSPGLSWSSALLLGLVASCGGSSAPPRVVTVGGSTARPARPDGWTLAKSCGKDLDADFPPPGDEDAWLHRERLALGLQLSTERNCKGPAGDITLLVRESTDGHVKVEGTLGGTLTDCDMVHCAVAATETYQSPHPIPAPRTFAIPIRAAGTGSVLFEPQVTRPEHAVELCGVDAATPRQLGHIADSGVQKVVRSRFATYQGCYREALKAHKHRKELEGDVVVRFLIGHDGKVSHAALEDLTLDDCDVAACIVEDIRKLTFPEPEDGVVTVTYPIHFEPE